MPPKRLPQDALAQLARDQQLHAQFEQLSREEDVERLQRQSRELIADQARLAREERQPVLSREATQFAAEHEADARRRFSPRKLLWKEIEEFDSRIADLDEREVALIAERQRLAEQRLQAELEYQDALTRWVAAPEGRGRPVSPLRALEERDQEIADELGAVAKLRSNVLAEKERFVQARRPRLAKAAAETVETARDRYVALARELVDARAELLDARRAELWAKLYPREQAGRLHGFETALALGLRKPVQETLGTIARLEYAQLVAAIERDADVIATHASAEQLEQAGEPPAPNPTKRAAWDSDLTEWKREQNEKLRELGRWHHDPSRLAQELER
jgi:hypothetical protein